MESRWNDREFDSQLRGRLGGASIDPPAIVWARLNRHRIVAQNMRRLRNGLAAAAVLLCSCWPLALQENDRLGGPLACEAKRGASSQKATGHAAKASEGLLPQDFPPAKAGIGSPAHSTMLPASKQDAPKAYLPALSMGASVAAPRPLTAFAPQGIGPLPELETETPGRKGQSTASKLERSYYFGMHARMMAIGIINQNTYGAFGNYGLAYRPVAVWDYGAHAGIRLSRYSWLETGMNFFVTQGQAYYDVINKVSVNRNVRLVYHQVPLVLRHGGHIRVAGQQMRHYWEGGLRYGRLLIARVRVNDSERGMYRRFRENEWSLVFGHSVQWNLNERVRFSLGIQGSIGSNINAPGWEVQGRYGKSHNTAFGLKARLYFQ
jgi:hypothetical protein